MKEGAQNEGRFILKEKTLRGFHLRVFLKNLFFS